jgi:hypothetical protein
MSASLAQRWTFTQTSPLGDVHSSYELTADGLRFSSDAPMGPGHEMLLWDSIAEAATAALDLPVAKGGPDMARWIPSRLEWLLVARAAAGAPGFMAPLPACDVRDAIVARVRERLGSRWVGERLELRSAQKRFRIAKEGTGTLKVVGLVLAVLAVLFLMLVLVTLLSAVLLVPAGLLLGAWLLRRGLRGLQDALQAMQTRTANVAGAALGRVKLEGRAITDEPSPAGVSGRPCVWWDVTVDAWYDDHDGSCWKQVMARHGGSADTLVLEDATGRVPVWLRDAELLLEAHTWESGRHELPAPGVALLHGTAFAWNRGKRLRVREMRMEANRALYVFGTLDEARHLPTGADDGATARLRRSLRTGAWRSTLLNALPRIVRAPVGIAIAYVDMLFAVGRGGERVQLPEDAAPPRLDPSARVVWKGRSGHSLIVSDQRETQAVLELRKRSLIWIGFGAVVFGYCLHELFSMFR